MQTPHLVIALVVAIAALPAGAQNWHHQLKRADSLFNAGSRDSAIALAQATFKNVEGQFGGSDTATAQVARILGSYYFGLADYQSAEPYHKRALEVFERKLPPDDTAVASACFELAGDYLYLGNYDKARPLFYQSLQIREKTLGSEHPEVARSVNALAALFSYQQKYDDVLTYSERAYDIWRKALGPDNPILAKALTNMAIARTELGYLDIAETLYVRLLDLREKQLGRDHPEVANVLLGLAKVSYAKDDYAGAKPLYQRAIAIDRAAYSEDHYLTAMPMTGLATVYLAQANYSEAETMFLRSTAIIEKTLGPNHIYVANNLRLLATLYQETGRLSDASRVLNRALEITRVAIGETTPEVATVLSLLGDVAELSGDYRAAETLHTQSIAMSETGLGPSHINLLPALNGLASTLSKEGRLADAEPIYLRSLRIAEAYGGKNHSLMAGVYELYAGLLRILGRQKEAQTLLARALSIRQTEFHALASVLPERQALKYASKLRTSFDRFLSGCLDSTSRQSEANTVAEAVLQTKGSVTDEFIARSRAQRSAVMGASSERKHVNETKNELSRLFVTRDMEDTSFFHEQDSLGHVIDSLEEQIARGNSSPSTGLSWAGITVPAIQVDVPSHTTLIEYVQFNRFGPLAESGEGRYLAVVLKHTGQPTVVDLGASAEIDSLVRSYRNHMKTVAEQSGPPSTDDLINYRTIGSKIVRAVWEPLKAAVPDSGLVLISPDGLLDLISFSGLPIDSADYFVERYSIHYLSSGRDLLSAGNRIRSGAGLLVLGDPDFGAIVRQQTEEEQEVGGNTESIQSQLGSFFSDCIDLTNPNVQPLPGTRTECELVSGLWKKQSSEKVIQYTGGEASEENFKRWAPGRRMIHIATHGYYASATCAHASKPHAGGPGSEDWLINPLLASGLFLAGVNAHNTGGTQSSDGILTAEEVSAMDLDGTERVVLSACESGMGEIASGEGVYGLRRSFLMAGARTVVSSLWAVPDNITSQLMSSIYVRGNGIDELLRQGMMAALERLRKRGQPDHPFLWAPFISIGDWRN